MTFKLVSEPDELDSWLPDNRNIISLDSPAMQASTVTPDFWRRYSALSGCGTA